MKLRMGITPVLIAAICVGVVAFSVTKTLTVRVPDIVSGSAVPECGHWCVYRCSRLLGAPVKMSDVLRLMPTSSEGNTFLQMQSAFEEIGFSAQGSIESFDSFLKGEFPSIVHLANPDHYVLAGQLADGRLLVFDGNGLRGRIQPQTLAKRWTGHVLRVERPTANVRKPKQVNLRIPNSACIQFATLLQDSGDVSPHDLNVDFRYPFKNQGNSALLVTRVVTDCKCLSAIFPQEEIAPGESGEIVLRYANRGNDHDGAFRHEAVVECNDPEHSRVRLEALGNTDSRVKFLPKRIDFGPVATGGECRRYCFFYYDGEDTESLLLDSLKSSVENLTCRIISPDDYLAIEKAQAYHQKTLTTSRNVRIVELIWRPSQSDRCDDLVSESLSCHSNVVGFSQIQIPLAGRIVPPLEAVPDAIILKLARKNVSETKLAAMTRLSPRDGRGIKSLRVRSAPEQLAIQIVKVPNSREWTLEVQCSFESTTEIQSARPQIVLECETENGTFFDLSVPVYAFP